MYNINIMKKCANLAHETSQGNIGGPFGACIVKDGEIISLSSNTVLRTKDPTAHAEINAIRKACKVLCTYDLSGCELYATGYPCPMCLGAIMWANIKKIYVSGLPEDAEKIGFRDNFMYETLDNLRNMCYNIDVLDIGFFDRDIAQNLYETYQSSHKTIY